MLASWPTINADIPRWALLAASMPWASNLDPGWVDLRYHCLIAGLVCYAALTLAWTPDPLSGAGEIFHLIILVLVLVAACNLRRINSVMIGIALGLSVSSVIAIAQVFGWSAIPQGSVPAGLFYNRDMLAETAAPVFVWLILRCHPLAMLLVVPLVLCQSRIALFAVLVGLLAAWRIRWEQKLAGLIIIGLTAAFSALAFGDEKVITALARISIWRTDLHNLSLFGNGIGWFQSAYPQWGYAHSEILQGGLEIGIIPLGLLAIFGLRRRLLALADWGALASACTVVILSFPLHTPAGGFVFAVLASRVARAGLRLRRRSSVRRIADEFDFWPPFRFRANRALGGPGSGDISVRPASAAVCGATEARIGAG